MGIVLTSFHGNFLVLISFMLRVVHLFWAVANGHVKRPQDEDIQSNVLEIVGSNIQSTYITCPADPAATLGIKLPFLVMIVKNLKKYFTFEIQVLDDKNVRRRFRASNFQVCKFTHVSSWFSLWFFFVSFVRNIFFFSGSDQVKHRCLFVVITKKYFIFLKHSDQT